MAAVKEVGQHAVKVEVDEVRRVVEQKWPIFQHHFERGEQRGQLFEQLRRLRAPLIDATAAELAFLVPDKTELVRFGNEFFVENVVQFESGPFDFVLNVPPKNGFCPGPKMREEAKIKFFVEVLGDDLRVIAGFKHYRFSITDDRHGVIAFARQFPN